MSAAGYFMAGFLFGGSAGVILMCLATMAKRSDEEGGTE